MGDAILLYIKNCKDIYEIALLNNEGNSMSLKQHFPYSVLPLHDNINFYRDLVLSITESSELAGPLAVSTRLIQETDMILPSRFFVGVIHRKSGVITDLMRIHFLDHEDSFAPGEHGEFATERSKLRTRIDELSQSVTYYKDPSTTINRHIQERIKAVIPKQVYSNYDVIAYPDSVMVQSTKGRNITFSVEGDLDLEKIFKESTEVIDAFPASFISRKGATKVYTELNGYSDNKTKNIVEKGGMDRVVMRYNDPMDAILRLFMELERGSNDTK